MEAIKKKMQAMKLEKDNAMDRADACEQQTKDAKIRAEKARILHYYMNNWLKLGPFEHKNDKNLWKLI